MICFGFLILFVSATMLPGFAGETLVKTPSGYIEIAPLQVDDQVFGVNKDGQNSITTITHIISYDSNEFMIVTINDQKIIVASGQKFFLPLEYVWRKAKNLHEKDAVLAKCFKVATVQNLQTFQAPVTFYEIRLKHDHAFLMTQSDIVVHNCPLFSIGFLVTCGGGKFALEGIIASVYLVGLWISHKIHCGSASKKQRF